MDGKPTKGGSGSHAAYPNLRPPVRSAHLLIKFVPLEALERFRGAGRYASAIDDSLTHFGAMLQEPASIAELLLDPVLSGCGQALWRDVSTSGLTGPRPATSP